MKKINFRIGIVFCAVSLFFYSCTKDENPQQEDAVITEAPAFDQHAIDGQYIVVYREGFVEDVGGKYPDNYEKAQEAMTEQTSAILTKASISNAEIVKVYSRTIMGATLKLSPEQVQQLKKQKEIKFIEQDRIVTFAPPTCGTGNTPPCTGDGGGGTAQETPYGIIRVNGGASYLGSSVAWIIDSGIDLDHPDLNVDETRGYNAFTSGKDGKSLDDGNGHGSHVAGTIAAIDNQEGVVGVAAGAVVIPVKVLDSRGSGSYSGVIAGVDWVGQYGIAGDVANMSLGGPISDALDAAVIEASNKGIWFSLAAGNSSEDANLHSPARANGNYIVTISAIDVNDNFASFSNFGNPPVDYAAPGVAVKSTWKDGGYNTISGTSMAAPHAAGVLLLGAASTDGTVNGDKDQTPDAIIVH